MRVEAGRHDHQVGREPARRGQEQIVEHDAVVGVALAAGQRAVDGRAAPAPTPTSSARRCPDRTGTGAPTCTARRARAAKMSCVPLPWWTSQSTISTRCGARAPRRLGRDGGVVEQAEAHRAIGLGVVPGRAHQRERVARAAGHHRSTPPRPPRPPPAGAASQLPGDVDRVGIQARAPARQRRPSPRGNRAGWTASISASVAGRGAAKSTPAIGARSRSASTASSRAGDSGCPGARIVLQKPPVGRCTDACSWSPGRHSPAPAPRAAARTRTRCRRRARPND